MIIALILFLFLLFFIEPFLTKNKLTNNNEHGSARFASKKEIKDNFIKTKIDNIDKPGFPIYYSKNLSNVYFDNETPHWCFLGSTGSGKTVTAMIPQCSFIATAKEKRSVCITDPKGEIFQSTSKMFEDNGYKVYTIDFRNPELSNHINILEPIILEYESYIKYKKLSVEENKYKTKYSNLARNHYAEANRLINSISLMIIGSSKNQKDPFWNNSAKNLLSGLISFFLEEYELGKINREQITITGIKKFQNSIMIEQNFEAFKKLIEEKEYGCKSKDNLIFIFSSSENTYKSITAVFGEKMAVFDDVNVEFITSASDFNFNDFGKTPVALYMIVPDEDKTYYSLVTIIIGLLYKELVKLANSNENKCLNVKMEWLLDEFANCPPFLDIESMVSVGRSRGMRFFFFIQSFSQLNNVYGKEVARIILDNCGLVYLKTNTQETAEEVSKRLGKKTIESKSLSHSIGLIQKNGNKSLSLIARELMTADEIKRLYRKTIIFPIVGHPVIRDTILYNKFSCYSKGSIKRNEKINKLDFNKYFTIEDINKEFNNFNNNDFRQNDIKILNQIVNDIKRIFDSDIENIDYETQNERTYLKIILSNTKKAKIIMLKNYLKDKCFVLIEKDKCFEIHIKNF